MPLTSSGFTHRLSRHGLVIWMTYVTVAPFFRKFGAVDALGVVDQLEEVLLVLLLPLSVAGLRVLVTTVWGRGFVVAFGAYMSLGIVSWLWATSRAPVGGLILQTFVELKLPIVLTAFLGVSEPFRVLRRMFTLLRVMLLISIPLVIVQYAFPTAYSAVFTGLAAKGQFSLSENVLLARAVGAFRHPSQLAFVAAVVGGIELNRWVTFRSQGALRWALVCVVLLALSLQRQELAAFLVFVPVVLLLRLRSRMPGEKMLLAVVGGTIALGLITPAIPFLLRYGRFMLSSLGLADVGSSDVARVVFYVVGFNLATNHFPLGVGFGAFGGHGARVFDSPLYHQLGFDNFWWFRQHRFLTDTFWPHVYAEAGWLGCGAYVVALGSIVMLLWQSARRSPDRVAGFGRWAALYAMLMLIGISITSTVLTSMLPMMLGLMFVGTTRSPGNGSP